MSRAPLLVISPKDACWIGPKKEVAARVLQVILRPSNGSEVSVQYQVCWWNGNERKVEWLDECEVEGISPNGPFLPIGFARSAT